jgi:hypothetical protein
MSIDFGDLGILPIDRLLITVGVLPIRQFNFVSFDFLVVLVGDQAEEMPDAVKAGTPLVVAIDNVPWCWSR